MATNETFENKEFKKSKIGTYSLCVALIGFITLKTINFEKVEFSFLDGITLIFEAALVGALADWYAVTALFKYPLNIKIPHTNILAKKKDEIAHGISVVMKDFLPHSVIKEHLGGINFSELFEKTLLNEEVSLKLKNKIRDFLLKFLEEGKTEGVKERRISTILDYMKTLDYSKTVSKFGMAFANAKSYEKTLAAIGEFLEKTLKNNKVAFADKVEEEIRGELPMLLKMFANGKGEKVFEKVLFYVGELKNPNSNIADKIKQNIENYCTQLQDSEEKGLEFNDKIHRILADEEFRKTALTVLTGLTDKLAELVKNTDNKEFSFDKIMDSMLLNMKNALVEDEAKKKALNDWTTNFLFNLIEEHNLIEKSSGLIKEEITKLSENDFINFIEKNVYNDLQYIRLNGAVVGGLGGAAIYLAQVLISLGLN